MPERSIVERMFGAALLSASTYEDIEGDRGATGQAFVVVVLGAICQTIGMARGAFLGVLITVLIGAVMNWLALSSLAQLIGTRFFGGRGDWGQVLRALGFAQTPMILSVLGVVPVLGGLILKIAVLWTIVASVVAIRQALDLDGLKALLTAVSAWLAMLLIGAVVGMVFGIATLGMGLMR